MSHPHHCSLLFSKKGLEPLAEVEGALLVVEVLHLPHPELSGLLGLGNGLEHFCCKRKGTIGTLSAMGRTSQDMSGGRPDMTNTLCTSSSERHNFIKGKATRVLSQGSQKISVYSGREFSRKNWEIVSELFPPCKHERTVEHMRGQQLDLHALAV